MLLLKPSCECCDKNLPPEAPDAVLANPVCRSRPSPTAVMT